MIGETLNKAAPVIEACATPVDDPLRHDALMQTILTQRKVTARRLGATNENPAAANLVAAAHSSTLRRGAFRTIVALTILIVLTGPLA